MTAIEKNNSSGALALWQRLWPLACLAVALLVNVLWIGALGYALVRLL